jgi:hypothetical protein
MLNLFKHLTLLAAALVGPVMADMEKRAPGNWQLHPFGDTFDRVRRAYVPKVDIY